MHKTITKLLVLFIAGLLTLSCDKKNEEITPSSQMEYKGKTYNLSQGLWVSEVYDDEDIEELQLVLATSSLKLEYVKGKFESFNGSVTGVSLVMYMKKGTKGLDVGEYICDYDEEGDPHTFFGGVILNGDPNGQVDFESFLEVGKIIVKKNNNIYEITLDCTDEDGNKLKAFYKGELIGLDL